MTEGIIENKPLAFFFLRGQLLASHEVSSVSTMSCKYYRCPRCGVVWGEIIVPECNWHRSIDRYCDEHMNEMWYDTLAGVFEEGWYQWQYHSGELLKHNFLQLAHLHLGEPA